MTDMTGQRTMTKENVLALKRRDGSAEFDCIDCGDRVIRVCGDGPPRCALCTLLPGWTQTDDGRLHPPQSD